MTRERSKRVFLSYAAKDREFAHQLRETLVRRGASVFMDESVSPGEKWSEGLRKEIENATALILLIPSLESSNRNDVWAEAGAAKALGKPILAVLPPRHKGTRRELPTDIAGLLVLDTDERPLENTADTLLQAVPEDDNSRLPAA